jgi:hypothetical protein
VTTVQPADISNEQAADSNKQTMIYEIKTKSESRKQKEWFSFGDFV